MDKNAIKKYAVWARRELIERVSQRALVYGITGSDAGDPNAESVNGHLLSQAEKRQRQALIRSIKTKGYEQTIEEVAYTWFNRFAALRFMEVNGYLPSHIRVFTNDAGEFKPQILAEAIHLELDGLDMNKVYELESANKSEELFKYLLIVQCNALNSILPGMFQRIEDYTELLLPDYLLREGSVIEQMVTTIPEADWTDQVQIIGWLYQYYNTEPKDKVFADLKKNIKITKENIPAATQLFTPDWIVRYMVENSLGRLWVEGHPNDDLKSSWKYYLEEAEQEPEVQAQLAQIRKGYAALTPEDIKVIDPCCGSGHILVYLFDVLMQIYESYGYTTREAVASILEHNLYGLDIDDRAAQLSYFAVMMKARQYDRRFLSRKDEEGNPDVPQPHVYAIAESNLVDRAILSYFAGGDAQLKETVETIVRELHDAKEYGSILTVTNQDWDALYNRFDAVFDEESWESTLAWTDLLPLVQVAEALAQKYDVVVTNPPYMGSSGMSGKLSDYVKKNYPDSKSDLFACFIEHGNAMVKQNGVNCMVTMQSWMFLSSFEKMRITILRGWDITNLMHMENMVMGIAFGTAVTCFRKSHTPGYKGTYNHIKYEDIENEKPKEFPVNGNRFSQVSTDNFFKIPGSPVAYWVSDRILDAFRNGSLIGDVADVKIGMGTGKNDIFVREWWEVNNQQIDYSLKSIDEIDNSEARYFPYNKGGEFRLWYGNLQEILWFDSEGRRYMNTMSGHRENGAHDWYCHEGLTWSFISSSKFGIRFLPSGCFFDVAGSTLFSKIDNKYTLGFLASCVCFDILGILNPTLNYQAGNIKSLPIIFSQQDKVDSLVDKNIAISKLDWDSFETSWDFQRHPLVRLRMNGAYAWGDNPPTMLLKGAYQGWELECEGRFARLKANEEELNRIFIDIYGLQDELTPEVADKDVTVRRADLRRDIKSLISYAVGCMFGRYSLDEPGLSYAGGDWDGGKYRTFPADKDNIIPICDDEYFEDDIVGRFIQFIETVYGKQSLEANLKFIADALGGKGSSREVIRSYFINDFYADHLKVYQKRPIYWLFDSGKKNGFKCLIYMHRYREDTIARIRTDYVHEQQSRYRTAIADLEQRINGASTSERVKLSKQLVKLQAQVEEIRVYEEKIHHLADQMIKIDLDDGVKHNYDLFRDVLAKIK